MIYYVGCNTNSWFNHCCLVAGYDFERQRVLRTIPSSDFVPTTGFDGQRVYMKLKDQTALEQEVVHLLSIDYINIDCKLFKIFLFFIFYESQQLWNATKHVKDKLL